MSCGDSYWLRCKEMRRNENVPDLENDARKMRVPPNAHEILVARILNATHSMILPTALFPALSLSTPRVQQVCPSLQENRTKTRGANREKEVAA